MPSSLSRLEKPRIDFDASSLSENEISDRAVIFARREKKSLPPKAAALSVSFHLLVRKLFLGSALMSGILCLSFFSVN